MATIKAIEPGSVHQIQSGQVIVDLSSVVKELVENSIDAGASIVDVRFKNQGLESIEVQDNGSGISPENYESIALKHHTSKLSTYSDLDALKTFGFRGEALSSLCALSKFSITTCCASDVPRATKLEFKLSGELQGTAIVAGQKGTTVSVNSLFHNLPVRRRELERNIKREWNKVISLLNQYACIKTRLKFTVSQQPTKGKRIVLFATKGNLNTSENIVNIFGPKTLGALVSLDVSLQFESSTRPSLPPNDHPLKVAKVQGFVSRPAQGEGRQTPDRQMFFVNGRPCLLPQFAKVFNEVYRAYNASQSPFIFADVLLDTSLYDVNVSPDKRTILLHEQGRLLETLREALIRLFETQDHTVPISQAIPWPATDASLAEQNKPDLTEMRSSTSARLLTNPVILAPNQDRRAAVVYGGPDCSSSSVTRHSAPRESTPPKTATIESPRQTFLSRWVNANSGTSEAACNEQPTRVSFSPSPLTEQGSQAAGAFLATATGGGGPGGDHTGEESGLLPQNLARTLSAPNQVVNMRALRPGRGHEGECSSQPGGLDDSISVTQPSNATEHLADAIIQLGALNHSQHIRSDILVAGASGTLRDGPNSSVPSTRDYTGSDASQLSTPSPLEEPKRSESSRLALDMFPAASAGVSLGNFTSVPGSANEIVNGTTSGGKGAGIRAANKSTPDRSPNDREQNANTSDNYYNENRHSVSGLAQEAECSNVHQFKSRDLTRRRQGTTLTIVQTIKTDLVTFQGRPQSGPSRHSAGDDHKSHALSFNGGIEAEDAEDSLSLIISKSDFEEMKVVGQFNLGFILAIRQGSRAAGRDPARDQLFIIDQHASDEKYNFERLQATTTVQSQRLVQAKTLELTALEEEIVKENLSALEVNGFKVHIDESGAAPVGSRCRLMALPLSRETTFTLSDLEELISLVGDQPSGYKGPTPRPTKVRKMFAMRACRSSIMIGKALSRRQMEGLVRHMGELDKPWNCPHGRPTMRHLCELGGMEHTGWHETRATSSQPRWGTYTQHRKTSDM